MQKKDKWHQHTHTLANHWRRIILLSIAYAWINYGHCSRSKKRNLFFVHLHLSVDIDRFGHNVAMAIANTRADDAKWWNEENHSSNRPIEGHLPIFISCEKFVAFIIVLVLCHTLVCSRSLQCEMWNDGKSATNDSCQNFRQMRTHIGWIGRHQNGNNNIKTHIKPNRNVHSLHCISVSANDRFLFASFSVYCKFQNQSFDFIRKTNARARNFQLNEFGKQNWNERTHEITLQTSFACFQFFLIRKKKTLHNILLHPKCMYVFIFSSLVVAFWIWFSLLLLLTFYSSEI